MHSAWKPDMGPEKLVLLTEHHEHQQEIEPFRARATQTAAQGSAVLLLGMVKPGHGPWHQQYIWEVFKTMEIAEVWVLGLHRSSLKSHYKCHWE